MKLQLGRFLTKEKLSASSSLKACFITTITMEKVSSFNKNKKLISNKSHFKIN